MAMTYIPPGQQAQKRKRDIDGPGLRHARKGKKRRKC